MKTIEVRTKDQIITIKEDNTITITTHFNPDNKSGLIVKAIEGQFNYYKGQSDTTLCPIKFDRGRGKEENIKTIKLQ